MWCGEMGRYQGGLLKMAEEKNQVKKDLNDCWARITEFLLIFFGGGFAVAIFFVFFGKFIPFLLLVAAIVGGLVYFTKAYRRGKW